MLIHFCTNPLNTRQGDSIISTQQSAKDNTEITNTVSIFDGKPFKIRFKMDENKIYARNMRAEQSCRNSRNVVFTVDSQVSSKNSFFVRTKIIHMKTVNNRHYENTNAISKVRGNYYSRKRFDEDITNCIIYSTVIPLTTAATPFSKETARKY